RLNSVHLGDLNLRVFRNDDVSGMPGEMVITVCISCRFKSSSGNPSDGLGCHILERGMRVTGPVGAGHPSCGCFQPAQSSINSRRVCIGQIPVPSRVDNALTLVCF